MLEGQYSSTVFQKVNLNPASGIETVSLQKDVLKISNKSIRH